MTPLQKRYEELMPIFRAGVDGQEIQRRRRSDFEEWEDIAESILEWDYRIKPVPQYRPFTPEEAARELLGGDGISRVGDCGYSYVRSITEEGVTTALHGEISYAELASSFLYDGSPCGMLEGGEA